MQLSSLPPLRRLGRRIMIAKSVTKRFEIARARTTPPTSGETMIWSSVHLGSKSAMTSGQQIFYRHVKEALVDRAKP